MTPPDDEEPQQPAQYDPHHPSGYPGDLEADVVLRDGATAHLRPIAPADADLMVSFYARVSEQSKYYRFFAPYPQLSDRDVARFTQVDYHDRLALIVTVGDEMIGVGRYERTGRRTAEVAFLIEDAHQGRGLGQLLLEHLAQAARENGIARFRRRGTAGQPEDDHGLHRGRLQGRPRVRGRRDRGRVRHRADRHVVRGDAGPGAAVRGALDRAVADAVERRADRCQPA